jgi:putative copper resistance protein D
VPAAFAAARFLQYAAATGLFGLSLYPLYARASLGASARAWLVGLAVASGLGAWAWLFATTVNMAGRLDFDSLTSVFIEPPFGPLWAARLLLGLVLIAVTFLGKTRPILVCVLAAVSLASIGLTGHTQDHAGGLRLAAETADAAHLLGAGAWLGGLIGLALLLRTPPADAGQARERAATVARFSRMAYVAVGAIVVSGLFNAALLVGSVKGLLTTFYGGLLALKVALFGVMLILAGLNRFQISPHLATDEGPWSRRLARHVAAEQGLGLLVLLCVAVLGMSEPPAV